jgi:hypothetical protein
MADSVRVDGQQVTALLDAITKASGPAVKDVRQVVSKGALNIKTDAARRIGGLAHARRYPRSINYDLHDSVRGPSASIGPDKDRPPGALGNLLEYGSVNNPPLPAHGACRRG